MIFKQLRDHRFLVGMSPSNFSSHAAEVMADWNVLHPFREGNGRATREYMRTLAKDAGYDLDWR